MVDRTAKPPLHAQIATALRDAIQRDILTPGSLLPSTRTLADSLGVSRNTVTAAFDTLERQSLIRRIRGSGTRVCGALRLFQASQTTWRDVIRKSGYPERIASFVDQDGNGLYLNRG